jgi:hypothetical protein
LALHCCLNFFILHTMKYFYVSHNERSESGAFFSAALDFCFFSSRKRK